MSTKLYDLEGLDLLRTRWRLQQGTHALDKHSVISDGSLPTDFLYYCL